MIRSLLFSLIATILVTIIVCVWVNTWFAHGYNWLWIAIPTFWVSKQIFSRIFRLLDIIIGIAIISVITFFSGHGITLPW